AAKAASPAARACRPSASCWPSKVSCFFSQARLVRPGDASLSRLCPARGSGWVGGEARRHPLTSPLPLAGARKMLGRVVMRVLITRREREATALAQALADRGHQAVLAPLFRLQILHPPDGFAQTLAASQAVLITSTNGARALAEVSEQRSKPVLAVGD